MFFMMSYSSLGLTCSLPPPPSLAGQHRRAKCAERLRLPKQCSGLLRHASRVAAVVHVETCSTRFAYRAEDLSAPFTMGAGL